MYSERITEDTIADFSRQNGWCPEPHTPDECDEFSAYIDTILDMNSNSRGRSFWWKDGKRPTDTRIKQIRRWIENEQFMCFSSAEYFITRYGRIRDAEERIIHFQFRLAQRILLNAMAECDDEQKAIQLFVLKARQLGISTAIAQFFLHRILFRPNTYAVMASVQAQQSDKLAAMADLTWSRLPFWLPPAKTILKAKEPKWSNGSALSVQSGTQEVGIAQGTSPSCIHLCFSPNTMIRTSNGGILEVSRLCIGDELIAEDGSITKVKNVIKSSRQHEITASLTPWCHYDNQSTTLDHPVLTPTGMVDAGNLNKNDEVTYPVRPISYEFTESSVFHRSTGRTSKPPKEEKVMHERDLGWVCGLYLAEGNIHKNIRLDSVDSITFAMHPKEVDRNLSGLKRIFKDLNLTPKGNKISKTKTITVNNAGWARWFMDMFGRVKTKHIPDCVFYMGDDFCRGLLHGYLEGDGHISPRVSTVMASTICQGMAFQIRELSISLGYGLPSIYHRDSGVFYNRNCKEIWTNCWSGIHAQHMREDFGWPSPNGIIRKSPRHWRYSEDGLFIYVRLKRVDRGFSEEFYDVEVEHHSHRFSTSQMIVSNSELGDYTNPKRVLEEGLFPACHPTRSLFMVLEGTGSTATTWQKEKWDYYSANVGKGGKFTPFFIPPSCAGDLYPHNDWIRANPIPAMWSPSDATRRMRRRAELFVRSTDYLWKVLGQRWEMDQDFQWYWECLYQEAVASHSEKKFLAQYAPTPEDAFQSDNDPVFRSETIEIVTKQRELGYKAYAITGRTVLMGNENEPYDPRKEDVDPFEARIQLHWEANDGNNYDYELVPLKAFDDSRDENCFDKLLIFEAPEVGAEYICAIDTAYGLNTPNEDRSTLSVHKHGHGQTSDIQVAAFTSLRVNSAQMARIAASVGLLYGTDGDGNVTSSNPLMMRFIIEQVRKPGDECQHQLKIMGFIDHHIMHYYDQKGNIDPNKGSKEGWRTTAWSRSILLDRFVDAVNTGWLILHDPIVIRQLSDFERKQEDRGKSRMEHAQGSHDDNVFSCSLGWTGLHDLENSSLRIASRYAPTKKEKVIDDQWCSRAMILMD